MPIVALVALAAGCAADPLAVEEAADSDGAAPVDAAAPLVENPVDAAAPTPDLPTTCVIDGKTYAAGARDPANACSACLPLFSTASWTPTNADGVSCNGFCMDASDFDYSVTNCGGCGHACARCEICHHGACIPIQVDACF